MKIQGSAPNADSYRNPSNVIAVASLIVAIIALIVSIRGCHVANQAQELATKKYKEDRLIILTGKTNEIGDKIVIYSTDESITFVEGYAHFPSAISNEDWHIRPNDKTLYLTVASFNFGKLFAKKVPKKEGEIQFLDNCNVPIFIDSYYTSKGQRYIDRSLYFLSAEVLQSDDKFKKPIVKFTGLKFVERYPSDNWPKVKSLDSLFENDKGIYIPPNEPK